jgi:hypothetical protein
LVLDAYTSRPETKLAPRLLALTSMRENGLVEAKWPEIDLKAAEWRVPRERMTAAEQAARA